MIGFYINCLAQKAYAKLSYEVTSNRQDLRRILSHANMLEHLNNELSNRDYKLNGDKHNTGGEEKRIECVQDILAAKKESSCNSTWAGPVTSNDRNSLDPGPSESSGSKDLNEEEICEGTVSDFIESLKNEDNDDSLGGEDDVVSSRHSAVRVSVQEVSEFDLELELVISKEGIK